MQITLHLTNQKYVYILKILQANYLLCIITTIRKEINPFQSNARFLYPPNVSVSLWFSYVSTRYTGHVILKLVYFRRDLFFLFYFFCCQISYGKKNLRKKFLRKKFLRSLFWRFTTLFGKKIVCSAKNKENASTYKNLKKIIQKLGRIC